MLKNEIAKGFIRKLLVLDPAKRYTAKQAVMHPFIVLNCGPPPNTVEQIPKEISTSSTSFQKEGSNGKEISQTSAESNNLAPGVTKKLQQVLSTKNIKVYIKFSIKIKYYFFNF